MSSYEPLCLEQTSSNNGFYSFLESIQLCYLLHLNPSAYPEPDLTDAMPLGPRLIQLQGTISHCY